MVEADGSPAAEPQVLISHKIRFAVRARVGGVEGGCIVGGGGDKNEGGGRGGGIHPGNKGGPGGGGGCIRVFALK